MHSVFLLCALISMINGAASYAHMERQHTGLDAVLVHDHTLIHSEPELGHISNLHAFQLTHPAKKLTGPSLLAQARITNDQEEESYNTVSEETAGVPKAYLNFIYPSHNFW